MADESSQAPPGLPPDVGTMLQRIEPMIWSILGRYNGISREDKEDIKQEVMLYLWERVAPRWDPRIAKFSSFAYRCATNFITRKVQNITRGRTSEIKAAEGFYEEYRERFPSRLSDEAAERLAKLRHMVEVGRPHIKPREHLVMTFIFSNPFVTQRQIATSMGYKHPSAISMMLLRMRRRLRKKGLLDD